MAFERVTKLTDYVRSGVTLDAAVSVPLIRNVFFNKAPLHDGALILRNNRLVAAGCFLPLSTRADILVDLGTRHRAAIGLSEQSDAIVVVVSEETGTISVAVDGKLKSGYNYNTLKQELLQLMDPTANQNGRKQEKDGAAGGAEDAS
jgi:diadenylate cyclase